MMVGKSTESFSPDFLSLFVLSYFPCWHSFSTLYWLSPPTSSFPPLLFILFIFLIYTCMVSRSPICDIRFIYFLTSFSFLVFSSSLPLPPPPLTCSWYAPTSSHTSLPIVSSICSFSSLLFFMIPLPNTIM